MPANKYIPPTPAEAEPMGRQARRDLTPIYANPYHSETMRDAHRLWEKSWLDEDKYFRQPTRTLRLR